MLSVPQGKVRLFYIPPRATLGDKHQEQVLYLLLFSILSFSLMAFLCPCGSTLHLSRCCEPIILGVRIAETAKTLMQSRYTAYTQENWRYLQKTWHPQTRPTRKELSKSSSTDWLKLDILETINGGKLETIGSVEFIAHFISKTKAHSLHEISQFEKVNKRWVYVNGEILRG